MSKSFDSQKLISYFNKEKLVVFLIVFFGIFFNVCVVFGPILQGKVIDTVVEQSSIGVVLLQALYYFLAVIGIQTCRYFKRFYVRRFANLTSKTMRTIIYDNLLNMPTLDVESSEYGDLMSKCIGDVDITVEGMRKSITEVFDSGVLMVSYFVTLLIYDYKIALIGCLFIPIALVVPSLLKKIIYKATLNARQKTSDVTQKTYEIIDNAVTLRNYGNITEKIENVDQDLDQLKTYSIKSNVFENTMPPLYLLLASIGIIYILYAGAVNVINASFTIGEYSAFITMFIALTIKTSKAAKLVNTIQKANVSWKRIKPNLKQDTKTDNKIINYEDYSSVSLEINNLCFSYNKEKQIIKNLSIDANKGEIIGVTGAIASGKSSFGICLLGLYSYLGQIKICGKELSSLSQNEISKLVSYQGHNSYILSDSIKNNITFGEDKDISEVLKIVCLDEDVLEMKDGVDTMVGSSGVRLSGGQQARIAMARALIDKKPIIILDDPISAVDVKTEEKIVGNLREYYNNSIIIFISHRLNSFDKFNQIIMLEKDNALVGPHDLLMKESKKYKTIYNLQKETNND